MSGICLSIDTNPQKALNELFNRDLVSMSSFNVLNESTIAKRLITTSSQEFIKRAIIEKDYSHIMAISGRNKEKLIELALVKSDMWENHSELRIYIKPHVFDPSLNNLIETYANEWVPYSGITFQFVQRLSAEIIIELNGLGYHKSYIGKNALPFSLKNLPTMSLGIGNEIRPEYIRRPILHEFGHALGCIHEHQSPASTIKWNEAAAIRTYSFGGWSATDVQENLFRKFTQSKITNSIFDPKSIMIYPIDSSLTLDGYEVPWNTQMSDQDKTFMKETYDNLRRSIL